MEVAMTSAAALADYVLLDGRGGVVKEVRCGGRSCERGGDGQSL